MAEELLLLSHRCVISVIVIFIIICYVALFLFSYRRCANLRMIDVYIVNNIVTFVSYIRYI